MESDKILCYSAMGVAGLVTLICLLDVAFSVLGHASVALDIMLIIAAALILWQGFETARELR